MRNKIVVGLNFLLIKVLRFTTICNNGFYDRHTSLNMINVCYAKKIVLSQFHYSHLDHVKLSENPTMQNILLHKSLGSLSNNTSNRIFSYVIKVQLTPEPKPNRLLSVQFDFILKNIIRVQFGLTLFRRAWFEFGWVRLYFEERGSSSVRFDKQRFEFGLVR